jgi:hypothetical protein
MNRYVPADITAGDFAEQIKKAVNEAEGKGVTNFSQENKTNGTIRENPERLPEGQQSGDVQPAPGAGETGGLSGGQGEQVPGAEAVQPQAGDERGPGGGISLGGSYAATGGTGENLKTNEALGGTSADVPKPKIGEPVVVPDHNGRNFVIPPDFTHSPTFNVRQKFEDNIAALKLLRELIGEERQPTDEERQTLFKYVGFGGLKEVGLDPKAPWSWSESSKKFIPHVESVHQLAAALTEMGLGDVLGAIKASTQNAHYTSIPIIRGMYKALERAGFTGGKTLEPSMGTGHFFGAMPYDLAKKSDLYGIELDKVTGNIARMLYPDARVHVGGYEESPVIKNHFDLIISNIPFGAVKVYDPELNASSNMALVKSQGKIHTFFFAKSLETVRARWIGCLYHFHGRAGQPR